MNIIAMQSISTSISTPGRWGTVGPRQSVFASVRRNTGSNRRRVVEAGRLRAESSEKSESGSNLLGPELSPLVSSEEEAASIAEALSKVEINPDTTVDYSDFVRLLEAKEFQKADDEGRSLLLRLAGKDAQSRGWIYFTEVASIPDADMKSIDDLWKAASNNKFGYSIQKKIFKQCLGRWTKFFKSIDWTVGENNYYRKWPSEFIYSLDAKPGHLPVTNCLRGTQLLESLMQHKALETDQQEASDTIEKKWTTF